MADDKREPLFTIEGIPAYPVSDDDRVDALLYGLTNGQKTYVPTLPDYGIPSYFVKEETDEKLRMRIKAAYTAAYTKEILAVQLEDFINLVKKIVLLWAENLDDSDIRVAMIELHERPS